MKPRQLLFVVFASVFACANSIAENKNQVLSYQAPLVTESLLLDIASNHNEVFVVGERGHVLRSEDGENWTQETVPSVATLTAISVVENTVWVVGHDATILRYEGETSEWQVQNFNPDLEKPLLDVLFFDDKHGITVGAYGTFYRTEDGGASWQDEKHPEFLHPDDQAYLEEIKLEDEEFYLEELDSILPHLNRISRKGNKLYLAGEAGLLASSDDLGRSWQRMEINYEGSFFDVLENSDGTIIAAGLRGNLFQFDNDSEQWVKIDSGSQSSLNSIVEIEGQDALVVGNNGNMVCLDDRIVEQKQTQDSEAINNALPFKGKLIAATAAGIQYLDSNEETPTCNRINSSL